MNTTDRKPFIGRPPAGKAGQSKTLTTQLNSLATPAPRPLPAKPVRPALPDNRSATQKYIDELAPSTIVGRLIKFSKDGAFVTSDDGANIDVGLDFIALCDETLIGWIKFTDDGNPPERFQGLLYDGFVMPSRESLGDLDASAWPAGISGAPTDPWQHQICLVLQRRDTAELFTFATTSVSGRRAVGNLLKHYDRMVRARTAEVPVVKLRPGGFNHRDPRVGWVPVPTFAIVGSAPRDAAAKPPPSNAELIGDEIPF